MYAVIGDVVGSREVTDRSALQRRLLDVLDDVGAAVPGLQPLEPTLGDEFQGAYATVEAATRAALLVRLGLLPEADVRCGVGAGEAEVYDAQRRPLLQDGPAWWAAREALEVMAKPRRSGLRTWYVPESASADGGGDPAVSASQINAYLWCRDALVARLSERGCRMLRLALLGHTQAAIAEAEGVSRSAVSQQFAHGIAAVRDAQDLLREV